MQEGKGSRNSCCTPQMAAYPVLLPAYLVQYNVDTVIDNDLKTVTLTSFIEASHDEVSSPFLRPRVHAYIANVCKPRMIVEVVEVVEVKVKDDVGVGTGFAGSGRSFLRPNRLPMVV